MHNVYDVSKILIILAYAILKVGAISFFNQNNFGGTFKKLLFLINFRFTEDLPMSKSRVPHILHPASPNVNI